MKILFIGGTGRLSKDVATLAADRGSEVYLLTRGSKSREVFVDPRYHMLIGDIRDTENVKKITEGMMFDVIIDFLTYNPEQLKNTLSAIEGRYRQYIFISTATVYKRTDFDAKISENETPVGNDSWRYAYQKYLCEEEVKKYFADREETYTIIRPGVTYGNTRIPYPIVPSDTQKEYSLIFRLKNDMPVPVFDNGETEVTVTHTRDFAKGVVGLMGNEKAFGEAYHITTAKTITWGEVIADLETIMNVKANRLDVTQKEIYDAIPFYREVLIGDKGNRTRYDNSKICEAVPGLTFDTELLDGLRETVQFYEEHPELQLIDYYWMGCIDRLAAKHVKVTKPEIANKADRSAYFRGRHKIVDTMKRSLAKVKRKLFGK